jgi:hypothetical protein
MNLYCRPPRGRRDTRRVAIRRCVSWLACEGRWRPGRRMWLTGRVSGRLSRRSGAGSVRLPGRDGYHAARASVGWPVAICSWNPRQLSRRTTDAGGGRTGRGRTGITAAPTGAGPIGKRGCGPPDAGDTPDLGRQPTSSAALAGQRPARSHRRQQTGKVSVGTDTAGLETWLCRVCRVFGGPYGRVVAF